jgi:hypothetical protein
MFRLGGMLLAALATALIMTVPSAAAAVEIQDPAKSTYSKMSVSSAWSSTPALSKRLKRPATAADRLTPLIITASSPSSTSLTSSAAVAAIQETVAAKVASASTSAITINTASSPCPPDGGFVASQQYTVVGDCYVEGGLLFLYDGGMSFANGTLTLVGNLVLEDSAILSIVHGTLKFPQTGYSQYGIYLEGQAVLEMQYSTLITNNSTDDNNYSMSLTAYNTAMTVFIESSLDTNTGSWLLANYNEESRLMTSQTSNLPTEVYPNDESTILITGMSNIAGIWLNFMSGSEYTLMVPIMDSNGLYSFTLGNVTFQDSYCRLGINSYPYSSVTIIGTGESVGQAPLVFGYYLQDSTSNVTVSDLGVGNNVSAQYTDQGRLLKIKNTYLNPFSWQVYVSSTNGFTVTLANSLINELGVFTSGIVTMINCTTQIAVLEAGGTGAFIAIQQSQLWSQSISAVAGGVLTITDSYIHGNYIAVDNSGSYIQFTNTYDLHNGNATIVNCNSNSAGYPPNINGIPLCNPYFTLHRCADVSLDDDGTISGIPLCVPYPTVAPTISPTTAIDSSSSTSFWSSSSGEGAIVGIVIAGTVLIFGPIAYYCFFFTTSKTASAANGGTPDTTVNAIFNAI